MKAIKTKYLGPTDFRGGRMKASDGDGNSITEGYLHEYNPEQNHEIMADALCRKMGWKGTLKGGWFENEMYWVFQD